ncbi:hypothetical protein ES705_16416 [subsurface metagenome]
MDATIVQKILWFGILIILGVGVLVLGIAVVIRTIDKMKRERLDGPPVRFIFRDFRQGKK